LVIDNEIRIHVLKIKGKTIRLGIEAPPNVVVLRAELEPRRECRQKLPA